MRMTKNFYQDKHNNDHMNMEAQCIQYSSIIISTK